MPPIYIYTICGKTLIVHMIYLLWSSLQSAQPAIKVLYSKNQFSHAWDSPMKVCISVCWIGRGGSFFFEEQCQQLLSLPLPLVVSATMLSWWMRVARGRRSVAPALRSVGRGTWGSSGSPYWHFSSSLLVWECFSSSPSTVTRPKREKVSPTIAIKAMWGTVTVYFLWNNNQNTQQGVRRD